VNRAPVLTLWAAVVAEFLGFEHDETLTLGREMAGLNACVKAFFGGFSSRPPGRSKTGVGRSTRRSGDLHPAVPGETH